ncbi:MAG: alkaline phosphatase family protein [Planctomycetes bacterium]|nr:alkaline phosphatase family protein [Planctomycetota bacterium]
MRKLHCERRRLLRGWRQLGLRELIAAVLGCAVVLSAWWSSGHELSLTEQAYIGPGAGIALLGSFLAVLGALTSAFLVMLTWPIRRIWRLIKGRKSYAQAKVKRVIVLGLDGLEPTLTEKLLDEGALPNLAKLREKGTYVRLGTSTPPLSPVSWACFTTGSNPGKHNIFDFITRDAASYRPMMSSVRIRESKKTLKLGRYLIPLSKPEITGLRKSKPFWTVLGEAGVSSAILRVPITFPPDKFRGLQLSAMCVPDLRGTQGMFSYYAEGGGEGATMDGDVGGDRIRVTRNGRGVESYLRGPVNSLMEGRPELRLPFNVVGGRNGNGGALLHVGGQKIDLPLNAFSAWVRIAFRAAPGFKVRGVCRFFLKRLEPPFEMYCTPIQIDPDKPVMPISNPSVYSSYLARLQGSYATLGLAEDTWSLSEKLMTEDAFLTQAYDIHREREQMYFDALRNIRQGVVVCVFDGPDRIQHMFFRFLEDDHPAIRNQENTHPSAIRDMYARMDELVGRTLEECGDDDALFVMSDHGFKQFRRGVDLNAWLHENGYLKLKDGAATSTKTYLADMDWAETKAYAIGLAGIFLNVKGREAHGIVEGGEERRQLAREIADKLTGLRDPENGKVAIHQAMLREEVYKGPYTRAAPDLIVGYSEGYRVSWDAAVGKCSASVFSDNVKAWSGDHCIHPQLVPGVLFSNMKLRDQEANIVDLAPTTLELFGLETPGYMDGKSLLCAEQSA